MEIMTVKEIKDFIKDLPDDMECYTEFRTVKPIYDIGILTKTTNGKNPKKHLIFDNRKTV